MRASEATAKSYARALFDLGRERNQIDPIGAELEALAELMTAQPGLQDFLSRPWVGAGTKRGVAVEVATKMSLSPLMRDFLALVAARSRADHLTAIAVAFRALTDQYKQRVRVKLRTAVRLTDAERENLTRRLSRLLENRELVIEESVDSTLLGGFVAEVGSTVLDGSLDRQLARMHERLVRA